MLIGKHTIKTENNNKLYDFFGNRRTYSVEIHHNEFSQKFWMTNSIVHFIKEKRTNTMLMIVLDTPYPGPNDPSSLDCAESYFAPRTLKFHEVRKVRLDKCEIFFRKK